MGVPYLGRGWLGRWWPNLPQYRFQGKPYHLIVRRDTEVFSKSRNGFNVLFI
jgi:hypothetical protein